MFYYGQLRLAVRTGFYSRPTGDRLHKFLATSGEIGSLMSFITTN